MHHFRAYILLTLSSLYLLSCSPSIGRRVIPKETFEAETFATALLGDPEASIPLLPNLGVALRYGLTDKITIGTTLDLISFALEGTIFMEPFAVGNIVPQKGNLPAINLYTGIPLVCFPKKRGITVFPMVGVCPNWHTGKFDVFASYEASFDSKTFEDGVDVHSSVRCGGTFYPQSYRGIYLELGFLNINHPSWINNSKAGIFSISVGLTQNITSWRNTRKHD